MFFFLLLFLFTDQIFASWRQVAFILVVTMDRLVDKVIETRSLSYTAHLARLNLTDKAYLNS